jgi:hypothetical protein
MLALKRSLFNRVYILINVLKVFIHSSVAVQPFVGPWPLFQFRNRIHIRKDSLDGGSARRKAATYIEHDKHRINAHRHPYLEWDLNPRPQCSSGRRRFMPQTALPP